MSIKTNLNKSDGQTKMISNIFNKKNKILTHFRLEFLGHDQWSWRNAGGLTGGHWWWYRRRQAGGWRLFPWWLGNWGVASGWGQRLGFENGRGRLGHLLYLIRHLPAKKHIIFSLKKKQKMKKLLKIKAESLLMLLEHKYPTLFMIFFLFIFMLG